jgi:hypothetical protein
LLGKWRRPEALRKDPQKPPQNLRFPHGLHGNAESIRKGALFKKALMFLTFTPVLHLVASCGRKTLEQAIGVRIPGGQPISYFLPVIASNMLNSEQ